MLKSDVTNVMAKNAALVTRNSVRSPRDTKCIALLHRKRLIYELVQLSHCFVLIKSDEAVLIAVCMLSRSKVEHKANADRQRTLHFDDTSDR